MANESTAYSAKEVAELLKINTSTLRKYALLLENEGYPFYYNERNQRGYLDKDVLIFQRLMNVVQSKGMTLKRGAEAVMSGLSEDDKTPRVMENDSAITRHNADSQRIQQLEEHIQKQSEMLTELRQLVHDQNDKMDALLENKQIEGERKERGFLSRLFGKK